MSTSPVSVFIGAKGGVGTTTLCRELALAMRPKGNVALVDADFAGRRNIGILFDATRTLDAARSASPIATARVDGITVVELADRYDAAFTLGREVVEAVAASMRGFSAIVVDAPQPFAAAVRPFIVRASRFFVVLEPSLLGVAGAQTLLGDIQRFGIPLSRVDFVTNARANGAAIPRGEVEGVLGVRVAAEIPYIGDRGYAKAIATLQKHVQSIQPEELLGGLQPSSAAPIGDRRSQTRRSYTVPTDKRGADTRSVAAHGRYSARYDQGRNPSSALAQR